MTVQQLSPALLRPLTVGVIDSSRLFAQALAVVLSCAGFSADELPSDGDVSRFDLVLVDSRLSEEMLSSIARRVAESGTCRLILLSPQITRATRHVIRSCGAVTGIERTAEVDDLVETLTQVASGTEVALPCADSPDTGPSSLTQRELEILGLIATGATNEAVAADLGISPHTVRSHLGNILAKLNVTGRLRAVTLVRDAALLPEPMRRQVSS